MKGQLMSVLQDAVDHPRPSARRPAAATACVLAAAALAGGGAILGAAAPAGAQPTTTTPSCQAPVTVGDTATVTCPFTGAAQSWTVPAGVAQATFTVDGAQGGSAYPLGSNPAQPGGKGAIVTVTLRVARGATYQVMVGGSPQGDGNEEPGFNGGGRGGAGFPPEAGFRLWAAGGGGGASDIALGTSVLVVAGGGGGAGGHGSASGGSGGPSAGPGMAGASYGGISGGDGGQPGTMTGGGAGGGVAGMMFSGFPGTAGLGGVGAGSGSAAGDGGGGGGGYYGGGGGASGAGGSGGSPSGSGGGAGGGGSDFVTSSARSHSVSDGAWTGNGLVTISFAAPEVTALRPARGPAFGDTPVLITGTGLSCPPRAPGCKVMVTFGGKRAVVVLVRATEIFVISPPGTGTVPVIVTTGGVSSQATAATLFTYIRRLL
jgi:hypothetical protein